MMQLCLITSAFKSNLDQTTNTVYMKTVTAGTIRILELPVETSQRKRSSGWWNVATVRYEEHKTVLITA